MLDAAVVVREDAPGGAALVAFLTGTAAPDDLIREQLCDRLPDYRVPAFCIWLDDLPLNRRGKIDRAALTTVPITNPLAQHGRAAF